MPSTCFFFLLHFVFHSLHLPLPLAISGHCCSWVCFTFGTSTGCLSCHTCFPNPHLFERLLFPLHDPPFLPSAFTRAHRRAPAYRLRLPERCWAAGARHCALPSAASDSAGSRVLPHLPPYCLRRPLLNVPRPLLDGTRLGGRRASAALRVASAVAATCAPLHHCHPHTASPPTPHRPLPTHLPFHYFTCPLYISCFHTIWRMRAPPPTLHTAHAICHSSALHTPSHATTPHTVAWPRTNCTQGTCVSPAFPPTCPSGLCSSILSSCFIPHHTISSSLGHLSTFGDTGGTTTILNHGITTLTLRTPHHAPTEAWRGQNRGYAWATRFLLRHDGSLVYLQTLMTYLPTPTHTAALLAASRNSF